MAIMNHTQYDNNGYFGTNHEHIDNMDNNITDERDLCDVESDPMDVFEQEGMDVSTYRTSVVGAYRASEMSVPNMDVEDHTYTNVNSGAKASMHTDDNGFLVDREASMFPEASTDGSDLSTSNSSDMMDEDQDEDAAGRWPRDSSSAPSFGECPRYTILMTAWTSNCIIAVPYHLHTITCIASLTIYIYI